MRVENFHTPTAKNAINARTKAHKTTRWYERTLVRCFRILSNATFSSTPSTISVNPGGAGRGCASVPVLSAALASVVEAASDKTFNKTIRSDWRTSSVGQFSHRRSPSTGTQASSIPFRVSSTTTTRATASHKLISEESDHLRTKRDSQEAGRPTAANIVNIRNHRSWPRFSMY